MHEILDAILVTRLIDRDVRKARFRDNLDLRARWVSQRLRDKADSRPYVMMLRETIQMLVQHSGTHHQRDAAHIKMLEYSACSCLAAHWAGSVFWLLSEDSFFLEFGKAYEGGIPANCLAVAAWIGDVSLIESFDAVGLIPYNLFGWPICAAAARGHTEIVQYLLERGAPGAGACAEKLFSWTIHKSPLRMAVYMGREDIVRLLLEPRYHNHDAILDEKQAIAVAAGNEQLAILGILLDHYRHYDDPEKPTFASAITEAFLTSCERGASRSAQILLQLGADINEPDGGPRTCLQLAARSGSAPTVKLLLDWGARLEPADRYPPAYQHKWSFKWPLPPERRKRDALKVARIRGFTTVARLIEEKLAERDYRANRGVSVFQGQDAAVHFEHRVLK